MEHDKLPIHQYDKLPPLFNPSRFDAEVWVKLAKAAGAQYITITAKHHDGFCMFDSRLTEFDIVEKSPYHADPLKALAGACHEQNDQAILLLFVARLAPSRLLSAGQDRQGDRPGETRRLEPLRGLLSGADPGAVHQLRRDRRDLAGRLVGSPRRRRGTWRGRTG